MDLATLGNRIKYARELRGLTAKELAIKIGVSPSTIMRYEAGEFKSPKLPVIETIAAVLRVNPTWLIGADVEMERPIAMPAVKSGYVRIPVLGAVRAGVPTEAVEDVIDWEDIPESWTKDGEYFGLKVKGDSMEPRILEGDVVIVRRTPVCESGDVAVVLVNGDEATIKRIKKRPDGIMLYPNNPSYEPFYYSNAEIAALPVEILGCVVELRGKF